MVPVTAMVQRDGYSYVFTVNSDNTVQRVRVASGMSEKGFVEIIQGLKAGDAVVNSGAGFLGDGDRVRVVANANADAKEIKP